MDFSNFDARASAEKARDIQIKDQETGLPIMDGEKPCIVTIRGMSSRSVQNQIKAENAAKMSAKKTDKKDKDLSDATAQKNLAEGAARVVIGFKNIQRNDGGKVRDLTASPEDMAWFFDLTFFSTPHLFRDAFPYEQREDETTRDYIARSDEWVAANAEKWHKPSFAQQVLEAARSGETELGNASKA